MKRILFANHAQFEGRHTNLGDWAIFEQMVECLLPEIENKTIEIIVPSSDVEFTKQNYKVSAFSRGGVKGIINTLKWICKSDVVVIGGGEIVQDKSSLVYIPYQLIRPFIAKIFGKKLFGYAIGVGEKEEISLLGKWQAKFVLNMFDIITVRDEKSYTVLKEELKVNKPQIYLTADPALNLKKKEVLKEESEKYFVVSVRSIYHRNHNILPFSVRKKLKLVPREYYRAIDVFKNDIAKLTENLCEKYNCRVKFLNTYVGEQMSAADDKFTNDIIRKMNVELREKVDIIDVNFYPCQVKSILSDAMFIVTVPLHPLILGASENVPVFSLAYASKNKSFMKQIKHPEHIYRVENLQDKIDVEQIEADINEVMINIEDYKRNLKKVIDYNKKEEKKNAQLLLELIDEGNEKC